MPISDVSATPLEQLLKIASPRRKVSIGLPRPNSDCDSRFALTPEAAGLLVARGFQVKMQSEGAEGIHYPDINYQQQGVDIVERHEAFRCDIVVYLSTVTPMDARLLKRGAMLLTMFDSVTVAMQTLQLLLSNGIITIGLDMIVDERGHHPFADIISEISGRASIALASSLLADSVHGKGILLGGIAGIVPCEVTIIGSGIDACAAASSAIGLGAVVRMFDNDIYRLRAALRELGPGVSASALHPRVLVHALHAADVVIATDIKPIHVISADVVAEMKRGVITFDLTKGRQPIFPSLPQINLGAKNSDSAQQEQQRVCYINPGNAVPRTYAMALSNTFLTMISEVFSCDGMTNALMLNSGLQAAALTFMGKPVNPTVAAMLGMRHVDIKLILQFS